MFDNDKCLKIDFYYTILFFCLSICLEIKKSEKFLFNTKKVI